MLLVEVILRLLDQVHLLQIILYIVEFGFTIMHQGLVEDSLGTIQAPLLLVQMILMVGMTGKMELVWEIIGQLRVKVLTMLEDCHHTLSSDKNLCRT